MDERYNRTKRLSTKCTLSGSGEGSLKCVLMWPGINVTCKMEGQSTRVLYILLRWRERQRDDLDCVLVFNLAMLVLVPELR